MWKNNRLFNLQILQTGVWKKKSEILASKLKVEIAQSAGAVEYTNCFSAEG